MPLPFMSWHRVAALALGLLLTGHSMAELPPTDEQAIRNVVLNDELLDTLIAIKMEVQVPDASDDDEVDPETLSSIDTMVRAATEAPGVRGVLIKHRISARDYVIGSVAMLRAGMAAQFDASSPEAHGTSAANIAFVRSRMNKVQLLSSDDGEDNEGD